MSGKQGVRLLRCIISVLMLLALTTSMGASLLAATGSQREGDPTKANELLIPPQPVENTEVTGFLPNGSSPWTPDRQVAPDAYSTYSPAVATDSNGHLWMAAQCEGSSSQESGIRLMESTDRGATWTNISTEYTAFRLMSPDIAIDPYTNKVYVVYVRAFTIGVDYDILYGIYTPGEGMVWGLVIDSDTPDYDVHPSITCEYQYNNYNYLYVSYTCMNSYDDQDLMLAKSTDHGQNWAVTKLHGGLDNDVYEEGDITNADGRVYLAYRHSTDYHPQDGESDIWVDVSEDWGVTWTQKKVVDNSPKGVIHPSVAATHGGGTVVVAYEYLYSATDEDVYYAYSTDYGGTWSSYYVLVNTTLHEGIPSLTVDGWGFTTNNIYGKIHAGYWQGSYQSYQVYYRSADYSTPTVWSSPQLVNEHAETLMYGTAITTQLRRGLWYPCVTWDDHRNSGISHVYYSTVALAPAVSTSGPTAIGTTSATLNGNLTDWGTAGSVLTSFEWGTSTSYGNETTPQSSSGTGSFGASLTSLLADTTYHFRAKAVGDGTAYGDDMTFKTGTTPPTVSTSAATSVSTASATLNGNLSSLGTASSVQVSFEWGPTAGYGNTTSPQTRTGMGTFNAGISGLDPGATYHFRAKAVGDSVAYGDDLTLTTATTPPAVSTTAATEVAAAWATLNGNLASMGTAASVQVSFEWGLTTSYGIATKTVAKTASGTFSTDIDGLTTNMTYHFRAVAVGDGTVYGDDMTLTTSAVPDQKPDQPSHSSPSDKTSEVSLTPTLSASAFSDPDAGDTHAASQWQIDDTPWDYLDPAFESGTDTTNLTSISVPSGKLTYSTRYFWMVRYQDNHGAWSDWSVETSFTTTGAGADSTPPTMPSVSDDGASTASTTRLHATWSSSDPESVIVEYQYAIGTAAGGDDAVKWTSVGIATETTATGLSLKPGLSYYVSVKARNSQGLWSEVGSSNGITVSSGETETTEGNGVPFWVWILVAIGAGAVLSGVFLLGRRMAKKPPVAG